MNSAIEPPARASFVDLVRPPKGPRRLSRRALLGGGAGIALGGALAGALGGLETAGPAGASLTLPPLPAPVTSLLGGLVKPTALQQEALAVLGRETMRLPGSVPNPALAAGTDTLPGIEHIVVVMLENHSFDNILGMLGRGECWPTSGGVPTSTNPYGDGRIQHAFHMPTTCQLSGRPSQEWRTSHVSYNGGALDGFVSSSISPSDTSEVGGVPMGYWDGSDLPFTYALASLFPVADHWFSSLLGQTDPNRRYMVAGTSSGMTDDISLSATAPLGILMQDALLATPTVTIFDVLTAFGITWTDYYVNFPLGATPELDPVLDTVPILLDKKPQSQFFIDAAAGALPSFCLIEPDFSTQSQENPQNIVVGEAFLAQVIEAVGDSPDWASTVIVVTYDEHGGYYDHVPPPVALAPDLIPPIVQPGEDSYDGFARYGFRVPSLLVSPYAKRNYVSSVVYDHTSILALVERKWNLPALTLRDANANDLTDLLDLGALADRSPTFPSLPSLPAAGNTAAALACSVSGPGTIPPPSSISG